MAKVVIADSNQLSRFGLSSILATADGIEISGEVDSQESLLAHIMSDTPEIAILDYTSPGFSIDSVPACLNANPSTKVVAITPEQSALTIISAMKAGVMSYVKKDCSLEEIVNAVLSTARGDRFFCGQILETIREEAIDVDDSELTDFTCEPVSLTARELEIITYIAEGYTNTQIAEKLFLSAHTVNTHRKNIMQKLGVNNTASIVMYAVKSRLVSPNKFLFAPSYS
jgi:DNA-binding NarL/FixJ family response regulator